MTTRNGTGSAVPDKAKSQGIKRLCPVCKSTRAKVLFSQSFEQLSGVSLLDGYDLSVCQDCGAGFADNVPPQSAFDRYYRDLSKYEYEYRDGRGSDYDDLRFRAVAQSIEDHIPNRQARILEIGCATGHLLALLKERGYQCVLGADPSPGCAKAARALYGIPVLTHAISDLPVPENPFDVLILAGVMEHIRDLDPAVDKIRNLLSPDGQVYLAVPDSADFGNNKDAPFQEFSVEHLNFFSVTSLTNLMRMRGFRFCAGGKVPLDHRRGICCSPLYAVFKKSEDDGTILVRDEETEKGLTEYILKSRSADSRVRNIIDGIVTSRRPILVWGTGAHTQRLLAVSELGKANIVAFVDSSPKYQGQRLHGAPIWSPGETSGRTEPILISSYAAQHEIEEQIRGHLGLDNELILLYEI
jgi:SAM-dependent methyltransferase